MHLFRKSSCFLIMIPAGIMALFIIIPSEACTYIPSNSKISAMQSMGSWLTMNTLTVNQILFACEKFFATFEIIIVANPVIKASSLLVLR